MVTRKEIKIIHGMQAMTICVLISGIKAWTNNKFVITIAMLIGICMYTAVYYIIKKTKEHDKKKSRLLNTVLAHLLIIAVIGAILALNNSEHAHFNYLTVQSLALQGGAVIVHLNDHSIKYKVCWGLLIAEVILMIFL